MSWSTGTEAGPLAPPSRPGRSVATSVEPAALPIGPTLAGSAWVPATFATLPLLGAYGGVAYDARDGYVVTFGGFGASTSELFPGTWAYAGGLWRNITPVLSPSARGEPAMGYDSTDGEVVLFGGLNACTPAGCRTLGDTWVFAGGTWTELSPSPAPSARGGAVLVDDPADGGILLFGGVDANQTLLNDTWLFAHGTWSERTPAASPSPRLGPVAVTNTTDGSILLVGGQGGSDANLVPQNDTWRFANDTWTLGASTTPGLGHAIPSLAFDAGLGGGLLTLSAFGVPAATGTGTYRLEPGGWSLLRNGSATPPNIVATVTANGSAVGITFPVDNATAPAGSFAALAIPTYRLTASGWSAASAAYLPGARWDAALAEDPWGSNVSLFGGASIASGGTDIVLNDTWSLGPGGWMPGATGPAPAARQSAGYAAGPSGTEFVLFGGRSAAGTALGDTWTLSGGRWSEGNGSPSPPARWAPALALDPISGSLVLFGGLGGNGSALNDTWTFANGSWSAVATATAPSPRGEAAFAFDAVLGGLVLFGGATAASPDGPNGTFLNDTWLFRGGRWTLLTEIGPPPLADASFASDGPGGSGGLVLEGGTTTGGAVEDGTWLWNGASWATVATLGAPPPLSGARGYYDGTTDAPLTVGGRGPYPGNPGVTQVTTLAYGLDNLSLAVTTFPAGGVAPLTVQYEGSATGGAAPVRYRWTWADGPVSTNASGTRTVPEAGDFSVTAVALDAWGRTAARTDGVNVSATGGPLHLAVAATPTTGAAPLVVRFSAATSGGTPPYALTWRFDDGTNATGPNATHTYFANGSYVATVVGTDAAGAVATGSVNITVGSGLLVPLQLHATLTPTNGDAPLTVAFAAQETGGSAPVTTTWVFDRQGRNTSLAGAFTFPTPGVFVVRLYVNDTSGDDRAMNWTVTVQAPAGPSGSPPPAHGGGLPGTEAAGLAVGVAAVAGAVLFVVRRRRRGRPPAGDPGAPPADRRP